MGGIAMKWQYKLSSSCMIFPRFKLSPAVEFFVLVLIKGKTLLYYYYVRYCVYSIITQYTQYLTIMIVFVTVTRIMMLSIAVLCLHLT